MAFLAREKKSGHSDVDLSVRQSLSLYKSKNSPVSSQNIGVINSHQKREATKKLKKL